ncbi:MAG: glutamyl-tRNA reductase [Lachnospiraceae bacterium]|nr:glutamyl-tRNA reductase [Lachnospiraceae bacterium]MCI9388917.1 glutamyl-tRNA reductase [Lachnospiraceae bacterium]
MSIFMIGIDHNKASVDVRALFSFTKKAAGEAMLAFKELDGIHGCVILSTCNRMEVWVSAQKDWDADRLYGQLCALRQVSGGPYRGYFVSRKEREAVEHLFYLTSGLKSQILGEDQILTQVKDALSLAREAFSTDGVLEVLFRMAVTAGKRIKTEVAFHRADPSVIHQAIRTLQQKGFEVQGRRCMVIGNGEMGKMAAQTLTEAGGDVTVTIRQYRSGMVNIPQGCQRIDYGRRMELVPQCDLVVSATASPNLTLREELFKEITLTKPLILIDLAVPRDIETGLGEWEGITLYDMDSFRVSETDPEMEESFQQADGIVREQMDEFYQWLEGRDVIPRIQKIQSESVRDLDLRIHKVLQKTPMEEADRQKLAQTIEKAAGKVVNKLIFGLRDNLEKEVFLECVAGLEKVYEDA